MTRRLASDGERQFWAYEQLHPGGAASLVVAGFEIDGELDPATVQRAAATLVERHEILRSEFRLDGTDVVVVTHPASQARTELTTAAASDRDHAVALARALATRTVPLECPPLLRTVLVSWAPDHHILAAMSHHAVLDGGSLDVIGRELGALIDPSGDELPPPVSLTAVREEERTQYEKGSWSSDIAYWCGQLANVAPSRSEPMTEPCMADTHTTRLTGDRVRALQSLASGLRASPSVVLLTLWSDYLFAHTDADAIVIGMPVSGRVDQRRRRIVGLLMNTIPLVVPRMDLPARQRITQVRNIFLKGLKHHRAPLTQVAREARPGHSFESAPLYEAMFSQGHQGPLMFGGRPAKRVELASEYAEVPASLVAVDELSGDIRLSIDIARGTRLLGTADPVDAMNTYLASLDAVLSDSSGSPDPGCGEA